MQGGKDNLK